MKPLLPNVLTQRWRGRPEEDNSELEAQPPAKVLLPGTTGSLTRRTLIKLAVRIAGVIVVSTTISYFHMISSFKSQTLGQLEKYVEERVERENTIFALAETNQAVLKTELLRRLEELGDQDPKTEFDRLFARSPDGAIRNRSEIFDGTREAGVYIDKRVQLNADIRQRVLTFYQLANMYGAAWHHQLQNTYFTLPENIMVLYWPQVPTWAADATSDLSMPDQEYYWAANPKHNPAQETVWTGLYYDIVGKTWLVTCATPVSRNGKPIVTLGQDITLDELLNRTIHDRLPGAYNMIVRSDGRLIAHPQRTAEIQAKKGEFDIQQSGDRHLKQIFQKIQTLRSGQVIIDNAQHDEYLAVAKIKGPDWYFVTVYPKSILAQPAFQTARIILLLGFLSLLLEILVLFFVLRQQIAKPLTSFMQATELVAAGDFNMQLDESRRDELGHLGRLFNSMADQVYSREQSLEQAREKLRRNNEELELRVLERTTELSLVITQLEDEITERREVESALRDSETQLKEQALQLQQALQDLQSTQAQLIQTEKMSGLGQLVAGVAHEINNPVNFIYGNLTYINRYAEDLLDLVQLYQQHTIEKIPAVEAQIEAIELPFLVEDLPKLLASMKVGAERIRQIVLSLRNFSRLDEAEMKPVDIHEGIDSTLLILQNRLKVQPHRPEIAVVKEYGELPLVECYAGQLNQVFMNILCNAIDALEEDYEQRSLANPATIPSITIRTTTHKATVLIDIGDNGPGMSETVKHQLFNPFFTTKKVGEGTGLGLAISYQIVVEKHHGQLRCLSTPSQGTHFLIEIPTAHKAIADQSATENPAGEKSAIASLTE
ncbi:HAMP domain-containing protein [Trichocoleus sp. FACHB-591]|uniref:ATP-binding protein n=1 Tax=Trichocoleus sp. FACHB-591 TaxID=2692872 RepID=UPI0016861F17|nr:ATP-binding protein [Trichocoleus sp. FACHB-591]MBD2094978.1 HAMP domain-containing protein [Trichocoleus sp. FACHB-591]